MGTLRSSLLDPSVVDNGLSRLELRKEKNRTEKVMDELSERLDRWRKLKATPQGQALISVADPEIKNYEDMLSKPTSQLGSYGDVNAINEARAEWRGCLGVWKSIKYNLVEYERKLLELERMTKEEEDKQAKERKKKIEKFS